MYLFTRFIQADEKNCPNKKLHKCYIMKSMRALNVSNNDYPVFDKKIHSTELSICLWIKLKKGAKWQTIFSLPKKSDEKDNGCNHFLVGAHNLLYGGETNRIILILQCKLIQIIIYAL